ncbi:MAG: radical SAM protein [Verrucomicrobia bacterium]|nr:radical SAM protein [Verrucomicrobiota bacterium]MCG2680511.1 radical SAM protein [Kiritimatiellia bacterium]MBU4248234.1 radical SAM protein [Verrucomicrobiota bacterium]MBU4290437.1 radical SAM protein [Verrucomicrobiota bacterium]MBU4428851.1 radical SAM protein [Verrucomicrobiota bacterium]
MDEIVALDFSADLLSMNSFRHLFGPVPSRRFGRSLGVDLLPLKTCTLDCPFCEVGLTTQRTLERKEYVSTGAILAELTEWSARNEPADFITLAGSGEPTLHSRFGEILDFVAGQRRVRSALLTNSTLFFLPEVRQAAARADVVKATLSAWDQDSFAAVSRPHPDLRFDRILDGLQRFRDEYSGAIWMEVFIVPGVNSEPDQVQRIAALAQTIRPDRIQLNTTVRPPAERHVQSISPEALTKLAALFTPAGEVIARFSGGIRREAGVHPDSIVAMLQRRPCTAGDVGHAFSLADSESERILNDLIRAGRVRAELREGERYYRGG